MNDTITFTPESVRDTLLAAGFTEHRKPGDAGFHLGDGRESRGEIILTWFSGDREWTSLRSMWAARAAAYEAWRQVLAAAGFQAGVDDGYLIVTGIQEG